MGALPWCQFVADFCTARGLVYNETVEAIGQMLGFELARAMYFDGAAAKDVTKRLEQAVTEVAGCRGQLRRVGRPREKQT